MPPRIAPAALAFTLLIAPISAAGADGSRHVEIPPELQSIDWQLYAARVPQPKPQLRARTFARAAATGNPPRVLTFHDSNTRDGWNPNETVLTTSNVNANQFGMKYSVPVDGEVYAQPLFVPHVTIPNNGIHDVLFIATEGDSIYGLDAESGATLWKTTYVNPPAVTTFNPSGCKCSNIAFQQGITGTPVIDPATLVAYFVTKTTETSNGVATTHYRLHAAAVASGVDVTAPVNVTASAVATDGTRVSLDPGWSLQRPALALANHVIYVSFGSGADKKPLTTSGWIVAFDKTTLAKVAQFSTELGPPQREHLWYGADGLTRLGALWMSGDAPAFDTVGNALVQTGNGAFDGAHDWGQSVLKIAPDLHAVVDSFTPSQWLKQSNADTDIGSAGLLVLPQTYGGLHVALAGGKSGTTYLLNLHNMGGFSSNGDRVLSETATDTGLWGVPAAYVGPDGYTYAVIPGGGAMTLWRVSQSASPTLGFVSSSSEHFGDGDDGGSEAVVSSNGTVAGTAIVWAYSRSGTNGPVDLTLRAFDATNLANELVELPYTHWMGGGELLTPTVANGMVFAGGEGIVNGYGLL